MSLLRSLVRLAYPMRSTRRVLWGRCVDGGMRLYARQHGVPDFVKIDVEGAAGHVLRGAKATIEAKKSIFFIELHGPEEQAAVQAQLIERAYHAEDCQGNAVANATIGWHSPLIFRPA